MTGIQLVWGWQPALYLFLGGLGGGAFATAAALKLLTKDKFKPTIKISMWIAVASLALGLLMLLIDVSKPFRALMMWQSFSNASSLMAIGAWLLLVAFLVFTSTAVLETDELLAWLSSKKASIAKNAVKNEGEAEGANTEDAANAEFLSFSGKSFGKASSILAAVGILLGLGVAFYTGVLLKEASGISLWNTWALPALFTVSALDTGVAAVAIVSLLKDKTEGVEKVRRCLEFAVVALVVVEIIALFLFLSCSTDVSGVAASASITSGAFMLPFWFLVVGVGLIVPLIVALVSLFAKSLGEKAARIALVGAGGALVGGCALRFIVVYAGIHVETIGMLASVLL